MDKEFVNVSNFDDPNDYINNDGLKKCYDIGFNEYGIAHENEDLFASFSSDYYAIASINDNGRFLFTGKIDPKEAFKLLSANNFIDDSVIYIYTDEKDFDSLVFSSLIENVSDSSYLITIPNFESPNKEHNILINEDSLSISNDKGEVVTYDISTNKKASKTR